MATLPEDDTFPEGIYRIETTDPVLGGPPNEATGDGVSNIPAMQLAKRTRWLKARVDTLLAIVQIGTTAVAGIVRLNTSTNSTSTTDAATPSAVKAAMDNANSRALAVRTVAAGGLATGGGDLTGNLTITVPVATQAEAEARTSDAKAMTPLKVGQAIAATVLPATTAVAGIARLNTSTTSSSTTEAATPSAVKAAMDNANTRALASRFIGVGGLATGGGDLTGNRAINVPVATQAEAEAGSSDTKAMTPLRVAQKLALDFAALLGNDGYQLLPSGLIVQWGNIMVPGNGATWETGIVTFPIVFPTKPVAMVGSSNAIFNGGALTTDAAPSDVVTFSEYAAANMRWRVDTNGTAVLSGTHFIKWIAIGY